MKKKKLPLTPEHIDQISNKVTEVLKNQFHLNFSSQKDDEESFKKPISVDIEVHLDEVGGKSVFFVDQVGRPHGPLLEALIASGSDDQLEFPANFRVEVQRSRSGKGILLYSGFTENGKYPKNVIPKFFRL